MNMRSMLNSVVLSLVLSVALPVLAANEGEIMIARGVVTTHVAGGVPRIIGRGTAVSAGEIITTGARSLALIRMIDGTRITLRPNTAFEITAFDVTENSESGLFTLFKGGLRAVTGFMSKRNPNAMRLKTSIATIGIRGTEFDARLCDFDCATEARVRAEPAGRAGFVRGAVLARATSGRARTLKAGAPVYVGDTLITDAGSYLVVRFRDNSRVTLAPKTEFLVQQLKFEPAQPDQGSAVFRLLRGGLRAVTGAIGKRNQRAYRLRTSVATIGIRGTGYDLLCQGSCQNPDPNAGPNGDGLFAEVWDGEITIDDFVAQNGDSYFIADNGFTPQPVAGLPVPLDVPKPNEVDIPDAPPAPPSSSDPQAGLYVSCYAGNCDVETDENVVELEPGQASYVGADGGPAEPLDEVPPFQAEDPVLHAAELGESASGFDESLESGVLECTVQ